MAFDAGFLAAVAAEIEKSAIGAAVEKIYQPERDTVVLQMRTFEGGKRLLINAGSSNPRIGFTEIPLENPQNPPQFCMLLRKRLSGARLARVWQEGFERVLVLEWDTRDEMGFPTKCRLVAEMMGKYSNLIFTDGEGRIFAVLRPVDFTTSTKRQVLPGMRYELPPPQDKTDPLGVTQAMFTALLAQGGERPADKWITATFQGISATVAREIVYRVSGATDTLLTALDGAALYRVFADVMGDITEKRFAPSLVLDDAGVPREYAFLPLTQYGEYRTQGSPSALLDVWFGTRDREARVRQRATDILHLLNNARTRISHKLEMQRAELSECDKGEMYKRMGDLIVANCYQLSRGATRAVLTDYEDYREDGSFGTVEVMLDGRLSPTANAQRYYKKYAKSKTARVELGKQIALGEAELAYLESVHTALLTAETPTDLLEIREELQKSGYASRVKSVERRGRGTPVPQFAEYRTSGGYRVLCGKNNLQNEYITHKIATKNDYWFHAKNMPGSHVVLLLEGKGEPPAADFTEAASIAAVFSAAEGAPMTEVDYTLVRHLKRTPGAKPGFVIYHTNWSATVTPDREAVAALRVK
ncbi:MAG: fibronectin/fibrinogen-binding protein [Ruminococcaceae bacterium]|nr:fibronectin/fibrinogen-binding protein [Oscillospiraceae bacterium]